MKKITVNKTRILTAGSEALNSNGCLEEFCSENYTHTKGV